jgi:hypothetical protein
MAYTPYIHDRLGDIKHFLPHGDIVMDKKELTALFPNDPERKPDYFTTGWLNKKLAALTGLHHSHNGIPFPAVAVRQLQENPNKVRLINLLLGVD